MDVDIKAGIDRILELGKGEVIALDAGNGVTIPAANLPGGRALASVKKLLDEYASKPDRREGTDTIQDIASFGDWMKRHKDAGSVLFCDVTPLAPKLVGIVDYHQEGVPTAKDTDDRARFRRFRALYQFPIDKRWAAWSAVDGQEMGQGEFAAFLEDHVLDLVAQDESTDSEGNTIAQAPSIVSRFLALMGGTCAKPNEVVALSRGLEFTVGGKVGNRVNMQSGERAVVFEEVHTDGNGEKLRIPQLFLIAIPVFDRSGHVYTVPVRIRYRVNGAKLVWSPTLFGAEDIFERALRDAAESVRDATTLPLFYGTPA